MQNRILPIRRITEREWFVLRMLAEGIVPATIAQELSISVKTVSQHTVSIKKKLGAKNRVLLHKKLIVIKGQAMNKDIASLN